VYAITKVGKRVTTETSSAGRNSVHEGAIVEYKAATR